MKIGTVNDDNDSSTFSTISGKPRLSTEKLYIHSAILVSMCDRIHVDFIDPFITSIESFYRDNLSDTSAAVLSRIHQLFIELLMHCATLLDRCCTSQINAETRAIYKKYMTAIFAVARNSADIIAEVYRSPNGQRYIDPIRNEVVQGRLQRHTDGCNVADVYIEQSVFLRMYNLCNFSKGGIGDRSDICNAVTSMYALKERLDVEFSRKSVTVRLIDEYLTTWQTFQTKFITFIFKNYVTLCNQDIIECMEKFLDQQIQLKIEYKHIRHNLQVSTETYSPAGMLWTLSE